MLPPRVTRLVVSLLSPLVLGLVVLLPRLVLRAEFLGLLAMLLLVFLEGGEARGLLVLHMMLQLLLIE